MDGVMTDSEQLINEAAIVCLRGYGINPEPSDFLPFTGMGEDHYIGGVARKYGLAYLPEMKAQVYEIYFGLISGRLKAFPGLHDLLRKLKARQIRLAVASCADRVKIEANLKAIEVETAGFQAILAGDEVRNMKPAPDIYLAASEKLGVRPSDCCVIEDSINGIQAAKAAGMRCVAVAQSFPESELLALAPDCVRQGLKDISLADLIS